MLTLLQPNTTILYVHVHVVRSHTIVTNCTMISNVSKELPQSTRYTTHLHKTYLLQKHAFVHKFMQLVLLKLQSTVYTYRHNYLCVIIQYNNYAYNIISKSCISRTQSCSRKVICFASLSTVHFSDEFCVLF